MKITGILATLLAACMIFTLSACGGNSEPAPNSAPASQAAAEADDAEADDEQAEGEQADAGEADDYATAMGEYITNFEALVEQLGTLIQASDSLSTEEDMVAWCQSFMEIKETVGGAADSLAEMTAEVPEEYQESHVKITVATAAVYDAMTGFEKAVDAAINGDADAFTDGLAEFLGNMQGADQLWSEAVE